MNALHFQERWEFYQFIAGYRHLYSIERMCRVLKVSRSSYCWWFSHRPSKRAVEYSLFTDLIKKEFDASYATYGSTHITEQLKRKHYKILRRRV
ncbi:hypothetical protein [Allomuricauda sp. F6463D]|uniref:hypothetical protein n=1 Tax=Allomuricauda sp. F6463D TaxID=2926409 RepID=UPI001FF17504|nr:hypothetical protein [Muricauda sp. F6463D]MCK0159223.1 hypothetical protein [Muricauda sp. F6463D]